MYVCVHIFAIQLPSTSLHSWTLFSHQHCLHHKQFACDLRKWIPFQRPGIFQPSHALNTWLNFSDVIFFVFFWWHCITIVLIIWILVCVLVCIASMTHLLNTNTHTQYLNNNHCLLSFVVAAFLLLPVAFLSMIAEEVTTKASPLSFKATQ